MAIRCGNHGREVVYHATVEGVRSCCAGSPVMGVPATNAPKMEVNREVTEGMWKLGDRVIKVQRAVHGSGHLYTKELVKGFFVDDSWVFERLTGGMKILRTNPEAHKMTLEEAVQFGKLYGVCCRCGAILTNEDSISAGIGPVCAGKFS
jgi:hypothetical protein